MEQLGTAKFRLYLYLAGTAVILSVVLGRVDALLLGLPFLVTLFYSRRGAKPMAFGLDYALSSRYGYEDEETDMQLTVSTSDEIPLMEIEHALSAKGYDSVRQQWVIPLSAGESQSFSQTVPLVSRGVLVLGRFRARVLDATMSFWVAQQEAKGSRFSVFPKADRLDLFGNLARKVGMFHGDHTSRARGEGFELAAIREYTRGDAASQINWRSSLKWGKLFINERTPERNTDVVIIIDTLRDVGRFPTTSLNASAKGAAGLASYFLRRKDRVGLIEFGGATGYLTPRTGTRHLYTILERLAQVEQSTSSAFREVKTLPPRSLPPGALVFVFTTLLDKRSSLMVNDLAAHGFAPVVIYVSPVAMAQPLLGSSTTERLASRWWSVEQKAKLIQLERAGLPVVTWNGEHPLETCVNQLLAVFRQRH